MKTNYTRRQFIRNMGIAAAGLALYNCTTKSFPKNPNVVVILVDDLGWTDVGCYGNTYYETPNIDKLAAQGMKFTNGYASCAVCSPTRGSVMTGRYPTRIGITDWIHPNYPIENGEQPVGYESRANRKLQTPKNHLFLEHDEVTIPEILKKAGYTTCHVGKWHLGKKEWWPETHGFDYNIGGFQNGQPPSYFDPYKIPTLQDREEGEYLTDREAVEASGFIKKAVKQDKPFFLYMAHYTVHVPMQAKEELIEYYKKKEIPKDRDFHPIYAAMIHSLDEAVGTITSTLEEAGVAENTVIIFTGDNGGLKLPWGKNGSNIWTDNTPLRNGKGFPYEGGIREPFIVKWPGQIKPGTVSDEMVCSIDILPTICEMTGQKLPSQKPIDGKSLIPTLVDNDKLDRNTLYWHFPHYWGGGVPPYSAIREGDWKLIQWYETNSLELYNLEDDLSEANDLAENNTDKVNDLQKKLDEWLKATGGKLPKPNPDYSEGKKVNHLAVGKNIRLENEASPKYSKGNKNLLVNGIQASPNIKIGWLGFENDDFVATIDLKSIESIQLISVNFLQNQKDWIFMPEEIEFAASTTGRNYKKLKIIKNKISSKKEGMILKDFTLDISATEMRYIKIRAKNIGVCPKWHPGSGKPAWLFVDEIIVK